MPKKNAEWPYIASVFSVQALIPTFSDACPSYGDIMLVH